MHNTLDIWEPIYFFSRIAVFVSMWGASVHYLSTTALIEPYFTLIFSGLISGILWLFRPMMLNKIERSISK